jgi:hypothetical protein
VRGVRKTAEPNCDIPNPCFGICPSCHILDIRAHLRQVAQASWGGTCLEGRYRKSLTELFQPCSYHTPTPNEALEIPLSHLVSSPSRFSLICTKFYSLFALASMQRGSFVGKTQTKRGLIESRWLTCCGREAISAQNSTARAPKLRQFI